MRGNKIDPLAFSQFEILIISLFASRYTRKRCLAAAFFLFFLNPRIMIDSRGTPIMRPISGSKFSCLHFRFRKLACFTRVTSCRRKEMSKQFDLPAQTSRRWTGVNGYERTGNQHSSKKANGVTGWRKLQPPQSDISFGSPTPFTFVNWSRPGCYYFWATFSGFVCRSRAEKKIAEKEVNKLKTKV